MQRRLRMRARFPDQRVEESPTRLPASPPWKWSATSLIPSRRIADAIAMPCRAEPPPCNASSLSACPHASRAQVRAQHPACLSPVRSSSAPGPKRLRSHHGCSAAILPVRSLMSRGSPPRTLQARAPLPASFVPSARRQVIRVHSSAFPTRQASDSIIQAASEVRRLSGPRERINTRSSRPSRARRPAHPPTADLTSLHCRKMNDKSDNYNDTQITELE